jgi:hypothetical protein
MAFLIVGLVSLVVVNIIFIIDIELTLRRNKGDQNGDETAWGFGQVLSLLLLIIPLRDAWGALQEIREQLKSDQEQEEKLRQEKLKGVQTQFDEFLRRECRATPAVEELEHLIQNGADFNLWTADNGEFGNFLQLVAYYGKTELVQFFVKNGIEDKPGTTATSITYVISIISRWPF